MLTDYDIHQLAQPDMKPPPAGESYADPVFGTEVTVFYAGTLYDNPNPFYGAGWKYNPYTFDSGFIRGPAWLWPIDSKTLKAGKPIPFPSIPDGSVSTYVSACRPILWMVSRTGKLYQWDFYANRIIPLIDLTPYVPPGAINYQGWNIEGVASDDSRVLLIDIAQPSRIIAYDAPSNKVVWQRDPVHPGADYLKPTIDKSGNWISPFENSLLMCPVADVRTGREQTYAGLAPESLAQHNGHLHGAQIQTNGIPEAPNNSNLTLIDYNEEPGYQVPLMPDNTIAGEATYITGHGNDERWALAGGAPDPPDAWKNIFRLGYGEVFAFATDGSARLKTPGAFRRYCHTRAVLGWNDTYWQRVHPAITPQMDLCAFVTNWGALQPGFNAVDPRQTLYVMLFRTGLSAPSFVPRNAPLAKSDMRTPKLFNDYWALPGQTRGPIGAGQYAGAAKADGSGWDTETGLPATYASSSPPDRTPIVITSDGRYTIPADAKTFDVHTVSCRVGKLTGTARLVIGWGPPQDDFSRFPPGVKVIIPDPVTPPDSGQDFPPSGIPPQTVLNPGPASVPPSAPPPVKPVLNAVTVTVPAGSTFQFTSNIVVVWLLQSGALGSIDANGLYKAPATLTRSATDTVMAVSTDPLNPAATATVNISATQVPPTPIPSGPNFVTVTSNKPSAKYKGIAECGSGDTIQFSADVPGVTWMLSGLAGGTHGSIDAAGLYTSPAGLSKAATAQVVATAPNGVKGASNIIIDAAMPAPAPPQPDPPPPNPPVSNPPPTSAITINDKPQALAMTLGDFVKLLG